MAVCKRKLIKLRPAKPHSQSIMYGIFAECQRIYRTEYLERGDTMVATAPVLGNYRKNWRWPNCGIQTEVINSSWMDGTHYTIGRWHKKHAKRGKMCSMKIIFAWFLEPRPRQLESSWIRSNSSITLWDWIWKVHRTIWRHLLQKATRDMIWFISTQMTNQSQITWRSFKRAWQKIRPEWAITRRSLTTMENVRIWLGWSCWNFCCWTGIRSI